MPIRLREDERDDPEAFDVVLRRTRGDEGREDRTEDTDLPNPGPSFSAWFSDDEDSFFRVEEGLVVGGTADGDGPVEDWEGEGGEGVGDEEEVSGVVEREGIRVGCGRSVSKEGIGEDSFQDLDWKSWIEGREEEREVSSC